MIPVLFKEDEQIFSHNGIGALYESLSCDIWETENGSFTMELEYPVDGELFSELEDYRIIQAKPNDIDEPHNFRIYEIDKSIDELTVYVRANTITNDLGSNLITSYRAINQTPQQAMNGAKAKLIEPTNFDLISDIQTRSNTEWTRINPLNAIVGTRGSLVDVWGGEIKRTNNAIYLYSRRGKDKVATIRPGKNIEGLNMTVSTAGIATKVLPAYTYRPTEIPKYQMVTLSDGTREKRRVQNTGDTRIQEDITVLGNVVTSQYVNNYPFNHWRSVDYNDDEDLRETIDTFVNDRLTEAEESSSIIDNSNFPDELKSFVKTELDKRAAQYFTHRNPGVDQPTVRISVNMLQLADSPEWEEFKDLERIGLTDTVEVWVEEYDIDVDVRVTELQYDSLGERVKKFTAGSDKAPRQSVQEKQYADLTKSLNDYKTTVENGVNNIMRNTADGLNRKFEGYTEPPAELSSEGDIWFKEIGGGKVEIWIHDGVYWQPLLTEAFAEQIQADMLEQQQDIEEAKQTADEAVDRINNEIAGKFTSIDDDILAIETISNSAQANAQTALNQSLEALGDASTALTNAQTALNQVDGAISSASEALSKANDAQAAANVLSGQVSGFETTVAGFNQTVNNYEGQVSGFRNDILGLESTVANYESEVDEFGNTVSTYATEVSTMRNTVSGFESTVATYGAEVSNLAGEVVGYKNQVSTLNNTVSGFESVVTQVQYDVDNLEIGGRNLISSLPENWEGGWWDPNTGEMDGSRSHFRTVEGYKVIVEPNKVYTINGKDRIVVLQYRTDGSFISSLDLASNQLHNTFTTNVNTSFLRFYILMPTTPLPPKSDIVSFEFQLEKGNKATDWTPAPEDMATATQVSELSNTIDGFQSKVTKVEQDYAGISGTVASHTSSISNLNGQIALKANTTTVNTLTGRVDTAETGITTNANAIGLKASQSSVDTLTGRVNTAETSITANATAIGLKANQTTVDTLSGTVNSLGADVGVVAGQISSKVWNTDIETAIDGIEVGGRNLLLDTTHHEKTVLFGNRGTITETGYNKFIYQNQINSNSGPLILLSSELVSGENYTLSFNVHSNINVSMNYIMTRNNMTQTNIGAVNSRLSDQSISVGGNRIEIQFTGSGENGIWIALNNSNRATLEFSNLQLEKGNKATDWTPAPEDTTALINHVETELTQKYDSITATVSSIDGRVATNKLNLDGLTTTVQSVRTDLTGTTTLLNTTRTTVSGHTSSIATLRTDVNGKATTAQFNTLNSTVNGTIQRVGNAEGKITTIETNVSGLQTTVASKASQSQVTQLSNLVDLKVSSSQVQALINSEVNYKDTRNDNRPPSWYQSNYPRKVAREFKSLSTLGIVDQGTYGALTTEVQYGDYTGGTVKQTMLTDGGTWTRNGRNETWNKWIKIADRDWVGAQVSVLEDNINLRVQKGDVVSQLNIDAGRTLISSSKILLNANTVSISGTAWMSGAVITNSSITNAKIADATISSAKIASLDVSKINGNIAQFIRAGFATATGDTVSVDGSGITMNRADGSMSSRLAANGYEFWRDGAEHGTMGVRAYSGLIPEFIGRRSVSLYVRNQSYISLTYQGDRAYGSEGHIALSVLGDTGNVSIHRPLSMNAQIDMGESHIVNVPRITSTQDLVLAAWNKLFRVGSESIEIQHSIRHNGDLELLARGSRAILIGTDQIQFSRELNILGYRIRNSNSSNMEIYSSQDIRLSTWGSRAILIGSAGIVFSRPLNMNGNAITNQSDERLKRDIKTSEMSSLESIKSWRFVGFNWKDEEMNNRLGRQFGVIAQETPELAIYDVETDSWSIDSSKQIMMNSHAIHQLSLMEENTNQVASQALQLGESNKSEIDELREENTELRNRIEELEGVV